MRNRSIALAIAFGLCHDRGADAAGRIARGRLVRMSAGARGPRRTGRRLGEPGQGTGA
jgi:hypothetical protein